MILVLFMMQLRHLDVWNSICISVGDISKRLARTGVKVDRFRRISSVRSDHTLEQRTTRWSLLLCSVIRHDCLKMESLFNWQFLINKYFPKLFWVLGKTWHLHLLFKSHVFFDIWNSSVILFTYAEMEYKMYWGGLMGGLTHNLLLEFSCWNRVAFIPGSAECSLKVVVFLCVLHLGCLASVIRIGFISSKIQHWLSTRILEHSCKAGKT